MYAGGSNFYKNVWLACAAKWYTYMFFCVINTLKPEDVFCSRTFMLSKSKMGK